MVEEIRQVSFNIDDNDCGNNDELSTLPTTRSSLDIDFKSETVPVDAARPHCSITRMNSNSNFMLSNNPEVSGLELEESPAISKFSASPVCTTKGPMWKRTACVWSSFILFIFLVGAISLGLIVWSSRQETMRSSSRSNSESGSNSESHPNSESKQAPELFCQNRSTVGYPSASLFTSGYDIMRANPLHKNIYGRPLLEHTLLVECQVTQNADRCQPNVESVLIDNLAAYHRWTRRFLAFSFKDEDHRFNNSAIISAISSANDDDLLNIQSGLMAGNLFIMTHLNCPLVNTSRTHEPQIKREYAYRLKMITNENTDDEEELDEFIEDFGAHYVDQVILGTKVVIRFTLDRKTVDSFKRKNLGFVSHATATGLYILSRSNAFIRVKKNSRKLATDFMASAKTQIYSGSALSPPINDMQTADHWIQSALKHYVMISLQVKPIHDLFAQISQQNNIPTIHEKWWQSRKRICSRILSLELTDKCDQYANKNSSKSFPQYPENEQRNAFVLPLLLIWTNRSTVCLRTSWKHCLELCRNDPLCSAASICATSRSTSAYQQKSEGPKTTAASCPPEFQACDCALHRQQDFSYGIVSPKVVTLVPVRQDLRPVILRGFVVYGQPLLSVKRLPDLASCVRLCSRTAKCQIVSYSQYDIDQYKICKLFSNMTGNELRRKGQAVTLFIMATFSPCFVDEIIESARSSCPANAKCSSVYGMCVCMPDYFKNGTACISHNLRNRQLATEVNEYFDSNVHVNKKYQNNSNKSNEEQHQRTQNSLSSTLSIQSNISTTSCSNATLKTDTSSASSDEDVDLIDGGTNSSSELQSTTNKHQRQHMPITEKMNSFESISTTPMYTKPTKGRLDSTSNTSSYIPWQMKFWKRVTV